MPDDLIEVIVRPLLDGNTVRIAAKIESGNDVSDVSFDTNAIANERRFTLAEKDRAVIRPKLIAKVEHDTDQNAVVTVPLPETEEEPKEETTSKRPLSQAAQATQAAAKAASQTSAANTKPRGPLPGL